MTGSNGTSLPKEIADRFTKTFARFLKIEAAAGGLLLLALLLALSLANSPWALSFEAIWKTPIGLHSRPTIGSLITWPCCPVMFASKGSVS